LVYVCGLKYIAAWFNFLATRRNNIEVRLVAVIFEQFMTTVTSPGYQMSEQSSLHVSLAETRDRAV
jgi:hypothetical protein